MELILELWRFMRVRKKWWLTPIVLFLLVLLFKPAGLLGKSRA